MGDKALPLSSLLAIRQHYPITLHGVSLSIGSTDPLNWDYLKQLKNLILHLEPAWVSDHLCWTSLNGRYLPDLLPLPHHAAVISHVVERILTVQEFLGQRILLENVSRYIDFSDSEIPEWEFVAEVVRQADCDILLDVNNLYINAQNHQFCVQTYMRALPRDRVNQFHLAGHHCEATHILDTHDEIVAPIVWEWFAKAIARFGPKPTLIEWDTNIPPFMTLWLESQKAQAYYGSQAITAAVSSCIG
jgi:uncharacterized protein (UPF0276 family)